LSNSVLTPGKNEDVPRALYTSSALDRSVPDTRNTHAEWREEVLHGTFGRNMQFCLYSLSRGFWLEKGPRILWLKQQQVAFLKPSSKVLLFSLGLDRSDGCECICVVEAQDEPFVVDEVNGRFWKRQLKELMGTFSIDDCSVAGIIKSRAEWHANNGFCPKFDFLPSYLPSFLPTFPSLPSFLPTYLPSHSFLHS
jgi:hypothetical protein